MKAKKPILLVVMDGVGFSKTHLGDAVGEANTPTLDWMLANCPNTRLKAHGDAVGLPSDDDMGNSEVGHNAIGCGQIYSQGAKLVNESIESGKMYESDAWKELTANVKSKNSTMHFIGLLSDGNVHSNIKHLFNMIKKAKSEGISKVRVHALLDGRDVPPQTAQIYIEQLEDLFKELNDSTFEGRIASGGGRMKITMDRYQADWPMVERGWNAHVRGEGRQFATAMDALNTLRAETGVASDQDLPAFVIAENGEPVGKIVDGDSVILFNFRGDRAIELSMAFDMVEFDHFNRGPKPDVCYAGMLQYDGDLKLPARFLVNPPEITNTMTEVLVAAGYNEYAISETQKYGHVTYFWNGNRSGKVSEELETYCEIPSDNVSFDQRPWMKSAEITDKLIGSMDATIIGVESVDLGLARLKAVCDECGVTMLITADHGNADEMLEKNKKGEIQVRTAHSLNPVPFIIYDKDQKFEIKPSDKYGLANIAPTVIKMFGLEAPECWEDSMI